MLSLPPLLSLNFSFSMVSSEHFRAYAIIIIIVHINGHENVSE